MSAVENPAAFPCTGEGFNSPSYTRHGMTLRDWFAGQAIVGIEADQFGYDAGAAATGAYSLADAMLAERAKVSS